MIASRVFCSSYSAGGVFPFFEDLCRISQILSIFCLYVYISIFVPLIAAFVPITAFNFAETVLTLFWEVKIMHLCCGKLSNIDGWNWSEAPQGLQFWALEFRSSETTRGTYWLLNSKLSKLWATGKLRELHKLDICNHNKWCTEQALISFNWLSKQSDDTLLGQTVTPTKNNLLMYPCKGQVKSGCHLFSFFALFLLFYFVVLHCFVTDYW